MVQRVTCVFKPERDTRPVPSSLPACISKQSLHFLMGWLKKIFKGKSHRQHQPLNNDEGPSSSSASPSTAPPPPQPHHPPAPSSLPPPQPGANFSYSNYSPFPPQPPLRQQASVQPPMPAEPQVQETPGITGACSLSVMISVDKQSFKLQRHPATLDFVVKSDVECETTVYMGVTETVTPRGLQFEPQSQQYAHFALPSVTMPPGEAVSYKSCVPQGSASHNLQLAMYHPAGPVSAVYNRQSGRMVPLIVGLSYTAPNSTSHHIHWLYCSLKSSADDRFKIALVKQRLQVDGALYDLQDVFGDDGDEAECAICLCDPKKVIVMPCRHLSMCAECALTVAMSRDARCPICRGPIEELIGSEGS